MMAQRAYLASEVIARVVGGAAARQIKTHACKVQA